MRVVLLGVLVLLSAGSAAAQPPGAAPGDPRTIGDAGACLHEVDPIDSASCVVLYAHVIEPLSVLPLNVQRPPWDLEPTETGGFGGVDAVWDLNEVVMIAHAGFVDYREDEDGPAVHHMPGTAGDIALALFVAPRATWFVSIDADSGLPYELDLVDAGAAPCLTLRTTLESWERGDTREKTVLAEGAATRTVLSAPQALGGVAGSPCPDAAPGDWIVAGHVTSFEMDVQPIADDAVIPADELLVVRLEWFIHDAGDLGKIYPMGLRVHVGATTPNRIVVPIQDAVRVNGLQMDTHKGIAYLEFDATSPFGSYDIDPESVDVAVLSPEGPLRSVPGLKAPIVRYSVDHDGLFRAVRVVVPWDVNASNLPAGSYQVQVSAQNWQHTATGQGALSVLIASDGTLMQDEAVFLSQARRDTPADVRDEAVPTLVAAAMGVGAVALLWALTERRVF